MPIDVILKIVFEVIKNGMKLVDEIKENKVDYKNLTPEQIEELLIPKGWAASEIRKAADAKAGIVEED